MRHHNHLVAFELEPLLAISFYLGDALDHFLCRVFVRLKPVITDGVNRISPICSFDQLRIRNRFITLYLTPGLGIGSFISGGGMRPPFKIKMFEMVFQPQHKIAITTAQDRAPASAHSLIQMDKRVLVKQAFPCGDVRVLRSRDGPSIVWIK